MKIIKISQKNFKEMSDLYNSYREIYGDENTVWDMDDLEGMREIGQEFIELFAINFKK
jgi:hypothetical protein